MIFSLKKKEGQQPQRRYSFISNIILSCRLIPLREYFFKSRLAVNLSGVWRLINKAQNEYSSPLPQILAVEPLREKINAKNSNKGHDIGLHTRLSDKNNSIIKINVSKERALKSWNDWKKKNKSLYESLLSIWRTLFNRRQGYE